MATKTETLLNELKINYLTEEQYQTARANDEINDDELYMTPSEESDEDNSIDLILLVDTRPDQKIVADSIRRIEGDIDSVLNKWRNGESIKAEIHFYTNENNFVGVSTVAPLNISFYGEHIYCKYICGTLSTKYDQRYVCGEIIFHYNGSLMLEHSAVSMIEAVDLIIDVVNAKPSDELSSQDVRIIHGDLAHVVDKMDNGSAVKALVNFRCNQNNYVIHGISVEGHVYIYGEWIHIGYIVCDQFPKNCIYRGEISFNYESGAFIEHQLYKIEGTKIY